MNAKYLIFLLILCTPLVNSAQEKFTPYDNLPGINKSFKPTLLDNAPSWATMMYQYPVNFRQLKTEYEKYQASGKKKNPYTRYFRHWSRIIAPLVGDDGVISMPSEQYVKEILTSERSNRDILLSRNAKEWSFLGPKVTHWLKEVNSIEVPGPCPWQVNIYSFDIAMADPNVMYCGTETGAINKSTDKGLSWQLMTLDYYIGGGVNALVIHPVNHNIVYAAAGRQLHKTVDGGMTWVALLKDIFFDANTLQISPDGRKLLAGSEEGIFISENEGNTWQKKLTLKAYDVEFKPNDANVNYALGAVNQNFRIFISIDGGTTFNVVANFPASYKDAAGGVLAVSPSNPNLLMMTLLTDNDTPVIIKGLNSNGIWTWTEVAQGNTTKLGMDNGQGYYDLDMEISPLDEKKFVVATTTMYKTTNSGISFTAVGGYDGQFPIHPDIQDIKFDANGDIWVATDGGLSMSTDYFTTQSRFFIRTDGIVGSDFWGFDQGWNEDIIVGGRYHNGNTAISDLYQPKALRMGGAESPTGWVIQGKSRHVAFDDLGGGWVLPEKAEDRYKGRFLFSKFPNMEEYGGRRGSLLHHPFYHSHLYLGEGNTVWTSLDAGMTWDMLNQFPGKVMTMVIGVNHPDVLYADVEGQGLYRSQDGGISWSKKPALTTAPNGNSYWNGKLSLAVSAYNPDIIYACLQNGTWSVDKGKIFKSKDGGNTWQNITYGIDAYLKSLVIQPATGNTDILYLFTNARNNLQANVWVLKDGSIQWENFDMGYPSGMSVNHALPFYHKNKIRVAGNLGVWESELYDTDYEPIIRPWAERQMVSCFSDTISLEDHSIMDHQNTSWTWEISPSPRYLSDTNSRNPKVVLGKEGKYNVKLLVNHKGKSFEKTIENMIEAKRCPSVETCDNPARLTKDQWRVVGFNSEEVNDPGWAAMAIDNDVSTIWHTRWSTGNDPYPHFITLDLGRNYKLFEFIYLPRQDGGENGRVKNYELYLSENLIDFGAPIAVGSFENSAAPKVVKIQDGKEARYIRFRALSEVNGNPWASAAELDFTGCYAEISSVDDQSFSSVKVSPVPTQNLLHLSLPSGQYQYFVFNMANGLHSQGEMNVNSDGITLDVETYPAGLYQMVAIKENGTQFRMKFLKF